MVPCPVGTHSAWPLRGPCPVHPPRARWEVNTSNNTSPLILSHKDTIFKSLSQLPTLRAEILGFPSQHWAIWGGVLVPPERGPGCSEWVWGRGPGSGLHRVKLRAAHQPCAWLEFLQFLFFLGHYMDVCYGLNCVPPKFRCWTPNPQCDYSWRWGF